jgi:MFS family permease
MSDSNTSTDGALPRVQSASPLNVVICMLDSTTWAFGMALFSLTTIAPLFLRQVGASNVVIGALPALVSAGYLVPGLLVARRIASLPYAKWWLFIIAVLERLPLLLIALLSPMLGPRHPQEVMWLFLGGFAFHAVCLGLNQPAYWTVIGKVIPLRQRGRVSGLSGITGGLAGLLVDPLTRHLLTPHGISSLRGFGDCFLIGTLALDAGIIGFAFFDEPRSRPAHLSSGAHAPFLRRAAETLRTSPSLRDLMTGQALISIASVGLNFYVLEYARRAQASTAGIADFTAIGAVLGSFGSLGWGAWGDHRGNKGVLIAAYALLMLSLVLICGRPVPLVYYAIFAAAALATSGIGIAGYNIVMEFAGGEEGIAFYATLFNALMAPFRIAGPLIAGVAADNWGYRPVFEACAIAAALSLPFAVRMTEPRKMLRRPLRGECQAEPGPL